MTFLRIVFHKKIEYEGQVFSCFVICVLRHTKNGSPKIKFRAFFFMLYLYYFQCHEIFSLFVINATHFALEIHTVLWGEGYIGHILGENRNFGQ